LWHADSLCWKDAQTGSLAAERKARWMKIPELTKISQKVLIILEFCVILLCGDKISERKQKK